MAVGTVAFLAVGLLAVIVVLLRQLLKQSEEFLNSDLITGEFNNPAGNLPCNPGCDYSPEVAVSSGRQVFAHPSDIIVSSSLGDVSYIFQWISGALPMRSFIRNINPKLILVIEILI